MKKSDMVTKKDYLNYLKKTLPENAEFRKGETLVQYSDIIKFIENEIDILNKKANTKSTKLTKTQQENEVLKSVILENMNLNQFYTLKEIVKLDTALNDLSTSKISGLMKQLNESGLTEKQYDKKTPIYKIITE